MGVSVTENVTTVTATTGTTVTVTEDVTSVSVADSTATITVSPSETSVSISGNTTSVSVSGKDTSVNVTTDSVGVSGSQVIDGSLKILGQKRFLAEAEDQYPDFNKPLLHVTTKDRRSGKMIAISESDDEVNDGTGAIGMHPNASFGSLFIGTSNCGIHFTSSFSNIIFPCNARGVSSNNTISLGSASATFKDIYATDTTINTSDRNKKQDIQTLSEAERNTAIACKGLIRKYKWIASVEEKGSDARWHFGIIAQELEQAFSDQGLDAGEYGVFIKEEVEVDGVVEVHKAVRYNELLAFIIAVM